MIQPNWHRPALHVSRGASARKALQQLTCPDAGTSSDNRATSSQPLTSSSHLLRQAVQALVFDRRVAARFGVHALVLALLVLLVLSETEPQPILTGMALQHPALPAEQQIVAGGVDDAPLQAADESIALFASFTSTGPTERYTPPVQATVSEIDDVAPTVREVVAETEPVFTRVHALRPGDTLGGVAEAYGIPLETLVWANKTINGEVLMFGQELRIARLAGIPHIIQEGETIDTIAERYGVNADMIAEFKPNGISVNEPLPAGKEIFVVDASYPLPAGLLSIYGGVAGLAAAGPEPAAITRSGTTLLIGPDTVYAIAARVEGGRRVRLVGQYNGWTKIRAGDATGWMPLGGLDIPDGTLEQVPVTNDFPPPPPIWVWPARGAFTSGFGWRWGGFHNGIDVAGPAWSPIVAARAGQVIESGWCSGYGFCVKMSHGDGMTTVYGHMIDYPTVSVGEYVPVGSVIGYMGSSYDPYGGGYSTGVHLHFEVRVNGVNVDPLIYLP